MTFLVVFGLFVTLFFAINVYSALTLWTAAHDKNRRGSVTVTVHVWPLWLAFLVPIAWLVWGR